MVSMLFWLNSGIIVGLLKRSPAIDGGSNLSSTLRAVPPLLLMVNLRRTFSPASRKPFPEGSSKDAAIERLGSIGEGPGHEMISDLIAAKTHTARIPKIAA